MMGSKTVREVRDELRRGLGAAGDDPIQWLEQLMTETKRQGKGGEEVLESLRRFLEAGGKEKRRTRRVGSKK